jgi:glycosyltransferase A (GT-A) superfamily protein (DUF2064 family)
LSTRSSAILLFARSAHLDAKDKGLSGGEHFIEELTAQTKLKARRTGLPVFHIDEKSQVGNSFGERLGSAMRAVYAKGINHLLVIGNDSPDLSTETLKTAVALLQGGKTVLGPTPDGGTYLIGINRERFDYGSFIGLPWQEKNLFEALFQWNISLGGCCKVLSPLLDLDAPEDCRHWFTASRFISSRIYKLLLSFLSVKPIWHQVCDHTVFDVQASITFNKGSPC